MRSEGGVSSCFPTHDAMKPRHGWGIHFSMLSEARPGARGLLANGVRRCWILPSHP